MLQCETPPVPSWFTKPINYSYVHIYIYIYTYIHIYIYIYVYISCIYGGFPEWGYPHRWNPPKRSVRLGIPKRSVGPRYASVSAGDFHIVWLRDDGRVVAAGDNRYGQYLGLWGLGRSGLEKPMENPKSSGLSLFPHKNWHLEVYIYTHTFIFSPYDIIWLQNSIPTILQKGISVDALRFLTRGSLGPWALKVLIGNLCDLPRRSKKHRVGWFVWDDLPMPRFPSPSHHHLYVWDFIP